METLTTTYTQYTKPFLLYEADIIIIEHEETYHHTGSSKELDH